MYRPRPLRVGFAMSAFDDDLLLATGESLAVLRAVREASLALLESLTPAEWERRGRHSESGAYTVDDWLRIYAGHSHDHANQIRGAR